MNEAPSKKETSRLYKEVAGILILSLLTVSILAAAAFNRLRTTPQIKISDIPINAVDSFANASDMAKYISRAQSTSSGSFGDPSLEFAVADQAVGAPSALIQKESTTPQRVSQTNVQFAGIDEPDIVKTNGFEIFFSNPNQRFFAQPQIEPQPVRELEFLPDDQAVSSEPLIAPAPRKNNAKVLKVFPPENLSQVAEIEESGNMLLLDENLIFIGDDNNGNSQLTGYNVADTKNPELAWKQVFTEHRVTEARLVGDKIIAVLSKNITDPGTPCPIPLVKSSNGLISIPCTEVFHPIEPVPTDTTFTVIKLDAKTGGVLQRVTFTGSINSSVVYVSDQNVFITNSRFPDLPNLQIDFFKQESANLLPASISVKIRNLENLDISNQAKQTEIQVILSEHRQTLNQDTRRVFDNNLSNALSDFANKKIRDFERTTITKISLEGLEIKASNSIPGTPLNQFSIDEHKGNLRIATTVGTSRAFGVDTANDVYVLDDSLEIVGSIKGLAVTERIFSARFLGDKAYLVTFRQIDPFFVLDLSNPASPIVKGELKIPGFSSYLHPVDESHILGVGREDGKVKLSLFNVDDPADPSEVSRYQLDEFWTAVDSTHHAFLLDSKHNAFFLPAGQSGYIFSLESNNIELERAITDTNAQRAIFIDDYLYVIGSNKIVVLNEFTWDRINELSLVD